MDCNQRKSVSDNVKVKRSRDYIDFFKSIVSFNFLSSLYHEFSILLPAWLFIHPQSWFFKPNRHTEYIYSRWRFVNADIVAALYSNKSEISLHSNYSEASWILKCFCSFQSLPIVENSNTQRKIANQSWEQSSIYSKFKRFFSYLQSLHITWELKIMLTSAKWVMFKISQNCAED